MTEKIDPKALKPAKDIVAQDRNWTTRVNNELEAEQKWNNQWGYYAKGKSPSTQVSHQKRPTKHRRRKPLTIEFDSSNRKSIKSRAVFSRRHLRLMEKEIKSRSTNKPSTISTKTMTCGHCRGVFRKAGKNQSGPHVIAFLFSRWPIWPAF